MEHLVLIIALIGVLGVGAQWIAWRFNLPAIVVMAIAGLAAGPAFDLLIPAGADASGLPRMQILLGDFYRPIIAVAVAVILFEGGLSLNFGELRGLTKGVGRLVIPGVPIAWGLGSLAGYYLAGMSWPIAILFAGIMVVTGPTVIVPLLRQSKLSQRPATLLKWEGIVNDPLGALLAVLVYGVIVIDGHGPADASPADLLGSLALASLLATCLGVGLGSFAAMSFRRGWIPEYLKPPVLLVLVLVCFEAANFLQEEAGLLAVTAMGVTLANSRVSSIAELRLFKENIAVLMVSGVFIILTANLSLATMASLDFRALAFILAMLFVVRPITVFVSTIGAGLTWQERLLVGWVAPRGVVAVAVSSFFGASLVAAGYPDGARLIPLAFAMVFTTVILHGFTIGPLAKALGLASRERPGVLIVGASPWSVELAAKLKEMKVPVLVADASWRRLKPARLADVAAPVQAQRVGAGGGQGLQPQAAVLGEEDHRHLAPVVLADQPRDDLLHIGQGELLVGRRRQVAAPGVEDLHRLGASLDLPVEVAGDRLRQLVEQGVHGLRVVVEHGLGLAEVLARAALDHVGGQGPGAAGEADQRHPAVQFAADGAHRIHHVAQVLLRVGNRQGLDVRGAGDDLLEARSLAGLEVQALPHGMGDGQDVGEEDRRVQLRVAVQRLQGDFAGELGVHHQAHEVPGLGPAGAVLGQVATGLAHHPHRGDVDGLLEQGAEEAVVLQGSHGSS